MKVLVAVDKFKGSLTAAEVCEAVREGILQRHPQAQVELLPLADGGEGTMELLTKYTEGQINHVGVSDPLGRKIIARYGLSGDKSTAFIESAEACGLQLLASSERNPMHTTSSGAGELIAAALANGARAIVLGIGGTSTNDAGIGMASALGFAFVDNRSKPIHPVGRNLVDLNEIDNSKVNPLLRKASFVALCDVNNPLLGERGAAYTYGPQKGASENDVKILDEGLKNFERVVKKSLGADADFPGAGAGGGLGSGAKIFLHATVRKAMDYIAELTELDKRIRSTDIVITGEGKIDTQTLSGKVVSTVARKGASANKKVIALCGVCELREIELAKMGISKTISLTDPFVTTERAIAEARRLIVETVTSLEL